MMEYWNVEDPAFIGVGFKRNFLFILTKQKND